MALPQLGRAQLPLAILAAERQSPAALLQHRANVEGGGPQAVLEAPAIQVPAGPAGVSQGIEPHGRRGVPAGHHGRALSMAIGEKALKQAKAAQQGLGGAGERFANGRYLLSR